MGNKASNKASLKITCPVNFFTEQVYKQIYFGQVNKEGEPHGQGTWTTREHKYISKDNDNCLHSAYTGKFKNGKAHGYGEYKRTWYFPMVYKGYWKDGDRSGQGTMIYSGDGTYTGEWLDDMRHGKGKMVWDNGDSWEGIWKFNRMNGHGIHIWKDGSTCEGEWCNDLRNGFCTFNHVTKHAKYVGGYKDDLRHGQGQYTCPEYHFDGTWLKGKMDEGVQIFSNGDSLKGKFVMAKKVGEEHLFTGVYTYASGDIFTGTWVCSEDQKLLFKTGQGKTVYSDGRVLEGFWENDKEHGWLTLITPEDSEGGSKKVYKKYVFGKLFETADTLPTGIMPLV